MLPKNALGCLDNCMATPKKRTRSCLAWFVSEKTRDRSQCPVPDVCMFHIQGLFEEVVGPVEKVQAPRRMAVSRGELHSSLQAILLIFGQAMSGF